jgi:MarR family 2-MHQ and catechol resistance regulon transcriptional repressor
LIYNEVMKKPSPKAAHVWLVMLKAFQAMSNHALASIIDSGLCDSDFRILEILLHKGPLPVNTIGSRVNLTPGSISVAIDRLLAKGFVTRAETKNDRRVRMVTLTKSGKAFIAPIFQKHIAAMKRVFEGLSDDELRQFELFLKHVGFQAESLSGGKGEKR